MSASANPDIIDDGLVFLYDTDDGKSYKGEPTTNLLNHTTEFNNWIAAKNSGTAPTVTADTSVNPLGLVNAPMADKVYIPDDGTYPRIQQYFTPPSTNTHTFSVWIRSLSGNCDCFLGAFRNSPWSLPGSSVKSITGEWQRFTFSWTPPDTTTHLIYMGSHDTAAQKGNTLEFWGAQMEAKSHATQFTTGTRSATQGLLDRTGTSTIDISNASFDSNAQMTFDGTDDYINDASFDMGTPTDITLECIIRFNGSLDSADRKVMHYNKGGSNGVFQLRKGNSASRLMYQAHNGSQWYTMTDTDAIESDTWAHFIITHSGTSAIMYKNGVQSATATMGSLHWTNANNLLIGYRANSEYWKGDIPIMKIYNRALTAAEVLQNFNATKSRFGL